MAKAFPFYKQFDAMDCGPTCLRMIADYYGRKYSLSYLRQNSHLDREGVSIRGISEAAENIGMRTIAAKLPYSTADENLAGLDEAPLPAIVHWRDKQFVVVYKMSAKKVWVADPARGKVKMDVTTFKQNWLRGAEEGFVLMMEPTPAFYEYDEIKEERTGFKFLFQYLRPYRSLIIQLFAGLLLGSLFQLIFPFLTQAIVDIGISNQDIDFIYLILAAQLMLFLSQTTVNLVQSWILLHMGTRINVALISDFLLKLMRLPIGFFDAKMIGDLLQRIGDHRRIELFLTGSTINVLFSSFNLIIFGIVLAIYNLNIFLVFAIAAVLYVVWITLFLKRRKEIDYQRFAELSDNQSTLIELIQGMQEIKLQSSERKHRWQWAHIQARLFRANMRSLIITQYQDAGAGFINQLKDILISFLAATAVIQGEMTLGMMLAVQYIVGQLNAPLNTMIQFVRTAQDAKISLDRLGEIHNRPNEEKQITSQLSILPESADLILKDLSFRYNPLSEFVLKNINLTIPHGKVTAIVGTSGSGKTTLVKLLLGFYEPTEGQIKLEGIQLSSINKTLWRQHCGAVMQDGYLFSDTIANNIAESEDEVDREKLLIAVKLANIQTFIESLPLGYNTKIGARGNGISQGQRQRILIARAIYKNPSFLFFDEATNALDSENEKIIVTNLNQFFKGRTVVVVAHRLSTVRHADQIIVIDQGEIVEQGTHEQLVEKRGSYFHLIRNQLELGS